MSYEYNRNNSVGTLNGKTGHLSKIINNLDNNKNRDYEYDALGRLTKAKGGTNNLWQQQYEYDRYGNRTNVTASGVAADGSTIPRDGIPNLAYNTTSNRITTAGFEYDVAGNQTRALAEDGVSWLRFEYDAANRLRVVKRDDGTSVQAFEYGATNARVASWDYQASQLTIYAGNGGTTLSEYTEFTANVPMWTKSFTYLGDSALSTITPNGQGGEYTEYNHPDRLGTRVITNQQSGTSYEQTTLPFGTALNAESTISTNKKRFTSYDRSERTGLDYAVNRTYDSKQGRFTQVDPIGMAAASAINPQTLNLYTYCGNDPVNHTDPSGLFFGKLFKWIGKIFSVVNKILKWVVVAVAVAAIAIAVFHSGGAAIGFLKVMLGIAGKLLGVKVTTSASIITNFAGEIIGTTLSSSISIGLAGQVIAGLYAVGAIANKLAGDDDEIIKVETRCPKSGTTPLCPGKGIGQPGFWESLIPIWGSGRSAIDHFQNGRWGWGIFQTVLAITDIFLVKSIVMAGGKLLVKGGLTYAPKLLAKEAADPLFHGFSRLVDQEVIQFGQRTVKSSTYVEYTIRGTASGRSGKIYQGTFEIGINPKTNQITHRFFRPE